MLFDSESFIILPKEKASFSYCRFLMYGFCIDSYSSCMILFLRGDWPFKHSSLERDCHKVFHLHMM
jgi:hypothetical protein